MEPEPTTFALLNPGLYAVTVAAQGFTQFRVDNIRVGVSAHVGINASLRIGKSTDTVKITAGNVAQLNTQDATLGFTVESRSATDLPILYGNPFERQLLVPAVTSTSLSTGNHTYEGGSESSTVNGSQSGRTEFTLDGAPDTRNGGAVTTAYIPSRDFIGEFRLITSPYDASIAHTSGGSLDTSIKSGTSQFHGNATFFYQDPHVDAPQFSQGPSKAPALKYHRESGDVGGPILRRKLFFFADYEHQYNLQAASTTTQTVPTVAEKHFSLGIQYALPADMVLSADYVGTLGRHLRITHDFDPVPNSILSTSPVRDASMDAINARLSAACPNPFQGIDVPGSSSLTGKTISGSQLVRPFPEFTGLTAGDEAGISNYNGLQVSAQKRFSHGYNMSVSYSWSRTLDALTFLNPGDPKPWYGTSNTDYPQVLSIASIYELPFGYGKPFFASTPHWADEIIRGFQVEGTYRIQSGQPLTFNSSGTVLKPGARLSDINGPSIHNYQQWFNTNAFENVADATAAGVNYANSLALVSHVRTFPFRFNNVRQDYQNLLNVGAMKKFSVYQERVHMDVRAEAINALNHQAYSNPTLIPRAPALEKSAGLATVRGSFSLLSSASSDHYSL